jgi:hypothetical protein
MPAPVPEPVPAPEAPPTDASSAFPDAIDIADAPVEAPPPPAPVPGEPEAEEPPEHFGWLQRARARASTRRVRRGPRRTEVVVRKIRPWSVLKFSLLFYFCLMLIVYLALAIIWVVLSAAGVIDTVASFLGQLNTSSTGTREPEPLNINTGAVFTWLFVVGCVVTVIWSLVNVCLALIYNLISDVIGGIEVLLAGKERD